MKNYLSRRAVLRGGAASIVLPFLESFGRAERDDRLGASDKRVLLMFTPNGVIQQSWRPTGVGKNWEPGPTLSPLREIKSDVSVLTGLKREVVPGAIHGQACSCWLTSAQSDENQGQPFPINTSLDQVIARDQGGATLYPTISLSCNDFTDNRESVYFDSISWLAPGLAAVTEKNPRTAFNRIFKVSNDAHAKSSILDAVLGDARSLNRRLSTNDISRLDEFLTGVRETESLIQRREQVLSKLDQSFLEEPSGFPERRGDYIRMMCGLICHAFEMDLTRVATLVVDAERWSSPRMFHGVFSSPQDHHSLTHDDSADALAKVAAIDRFHVGIFADVVRKLKGMKSTAGRSLLDESLVVMGSGMSEGFKHSLDDLPLLLAGSAGSAFKSGQHLDLAGRPLADLWLTIRNTCGRSAKSFSDSTGIVRELMA